jgi:hypothetical protein
MGKVLWFHRVVFGVCVGFAACVGGLEILEEDVEFENRRGLRKGACVAGIPKERAMGRTYGTIHCLSYRFPRICMAK